MIDLIIDMMESQGFHYEGFSGRVGEEVLTFKNNAGEIKEVRHGFTSMPPQNFKLNNMNTSFERGANRSDEWYTPKWIIDVLGEFDLDPCAPSEMFYTAKKCYTEKVDGLSQPWEGRVWLNPPYRNPLIGKFVERLADHGNGIALIFNRIDTKLWHDTIFPTATAMLILKGRLTFQSPDYTKPTTGAGCGSILIAWGEQNAEILRASNINGKLIRLK